MSRAARRYYRTLLLGLAALGAMLWVAIDQFGIPHRDMLELLAGTLLATGAVILGAAAVVLVWMALRRLWRRRDAG